MPGDKAVPKRNLEDTFNKQLRKRQVQVFDSQISGKGVKTVKGIAKEQYIMDYLGEVISKPEQVRRERKIGRREPVYFFKLNEDNIFLDAYYFGNEARFLNHS